MNVGGSRAFILSRVGLEKRSQRPSSVSPEPNRVSRHEGKWSKLSMPKLMPNNLEVTCLSEYPHRDGLKIV